MHDALRGNGNKIEIMPLDFILVFGYGVAKLIIYLG
jgi:hypothetical protein